MKEKVFIWAGAMLCLAYLLPNHSSPWFSFHQEFVAALAFAPIIAWSSTRSGPIPAPTYAVGALAMVPLIQFMAGQIYFATDAWMASLYLMGFALTARAGALSTENVKHGNKKTNGPIEILWSALLVSALLSAGIAVHQWLMPNYQGIYIAEIPPTARPFANLAQPNQLATLLLLGIAGLAFLWEARRVRASLAIVAAFMLLWALVMTGSRSALLALVWLVPAYAFLRKRCKLRTTPAAFITGVAFFFLAMWLWPILDNLLLLNASTSTALERMGNTGIRSVIWLSMLDAIAREPLFGYGWGQVSLAQLAVTLDHPATHLLLESAHNLLFDLALWNGLPVALAIISSLAYWFYHQVRYCNDPLRWTTLAGVAVVFNHAMVEFPLNYIYFLLPVGFLMGSLSAQAILRPISISPLPPMKKLHGMIIACTLYVGGLTTLAVIDYFPIETDWELMRFQQAKIGNLEKFDPPSVVLLTSLQNFLRFSRSEARPGMSEKDLETMRRNSERFAYAAPMFKYALAQALNHQPENALTTLRKMCSIQPDSVCRSAKKEWERLALSTHPELSKIIFTTPSLAN
ncbi:Wzy polymerase domain-containing protein [Acidovorax sp. NPDC077693]|uniref:PglL family O-oligosaccharyltransferase n=1 Tax=unclassified Acidovorax TaxID=2684926 RepID=UPI0037C5E4D2